MEVKAGDGIAVLESVKAVSDIYAPVSGTILEVNKKLEDQPELINKDPYGEGWIFSLEIIQKEEIDKLIRATEYQSLIENEPKLSYFKQVVEIDISRNRTRSERYVKKYGLQS